MPDTWIAPNYKFKHLDLAALGSPVVYHTFSGNINDMINTTVTKGDRPVIHSKYGLYQDTGKLNYN